MNRGTVSTEPGLRTRHSESVSYGCVCSVWQRPVSDESVRNFNHPAGCLIGRPPPYGTDTQTVPAEPRRVIRDEEQRTEGGNHLGGVGVADASRSQWHRGGGPQAAV